MTEKEAKKKVCPYKILAWAMNKCGANCEASGCMMWRCSPKKTDVSGTPIYSTDGCCGLGGKP